MLIIIDYRIPEDAKKTLASFGELLELNTEGITYRAISGHPDIFFCKSPDKLIVAPNLPEHYVEKLTKRSILYIKGELPVGSDYPASSRYNAVATEKYLIHNFRHTDFTITRAFEDLTPVHVDQGYCRCNLLSLRDGHFITSDEGIYKILKWHQLDSLFVAPEEILLEGIAHGFFGGCCGVWEDKVFIIGKLVHFPEGEKVRHYLEKLEYEVVELSDGQLVDGGGILFVGS